MNPFTLVFCTLVGAGLACWGFWALDGGPELRYIWAPICLFSSLCLGVIYAILASRLIIRKWEEKL